MRFLASLGLLLFAGCLKPESPQEIARWEARNKSETEQVAAFVAREQYSHLIASVRADRRQLRVVAKMSFNQLSKPQRLEVIQSLKDIWIRTADATEDLPPYLTVQDETTNYVGGYDRANGLWADN